MINPFDVLINSNFSIHGLFQPILLIMNLMWFALPLVTIVINDHVDISGEVKSMSIAGFCQSKLY